MSASTLPGPLPTETRDLLLREGWISEPEVDAMTGTKHTGRRRWEIPSALIGGRRFYRLDDVLQRMQQSYEQSEAKLLERQGDADKVRRAVL